MLQKKNKTEEQDIPLRMVTNTAQFGALRPSYGHFQHLANRREQILSVRTRGATRKKISFLVRFGLEYIGLGGVRL